jgi:hypothetical protein
VPLPIGEALERLLGRRRLGGRAVADEAAENSSQGGTGDSACLSACPALIKKQDPAVL